ncbi:MAG: MBL fold metallo-hydrolase [Nitrospirae bacterium]|nr:MBL fold metallo-hydrolase [Nitrospirota bacterium]
MIFEHLTVGMFQCNCFILGCERTRQAIVIDPGDALPSIVERVQRHGLTVTHIIATHAHLDHVGALSGLGQATGAPTCLHRDDQPLYDMLATQAALFRLPTPPSGPIARHIKEGDVIAFGQHRAAVLHTPGHTPGSVCFYMENEALLFSGDTLFQRSVGRTDLWGGDHRALIRSITEKLITLPPDTLVLPGHGARTDIGAEAAENPFLGNGY